MGAESKRAQKNLLQRAADQRAMLNVLLGPIERFGKHDADGCPKCGVGEPAFQRKLCRGQNEMLGDKNVCMVVGEHLHVLCRACEYEFRTQTRDSDDNPNASRLGAVNDTLAKGGEA